MTVGGLEGNDSRYNGKPGVIISTFETIKGYHVGFGINRIVMVVMSIVVGCSPSNCRRIFGRTVLFSMQFRGSRPDTQRIGHVRLPRKQRPQLASNLLYNISGFRTNSEFQHSFIRFQSVQIRSGRIE